MFIWDVSCKNGFDLYHDDFSVATLAQAMTVGKMPSLRTGTSPLPNIFQTSLAALSEKTGRAEEDLRVALCSRGALSEEILARLNAVWRPIRWQQSLLTLTGRSVIRVLDVALRRGNVRPSSRSALQASVEEVHLSPKSPERFGHLDSHLRT